MKTVSANWRMFNYQTNQSNYMNNFFTCSTRLCRLRTIMGKFTASFAGSGTSVVAVTLALLWVLCGSAYSSPLIRITPDNSFTTDPGLVVSSSGWNVLSPAYADFPGSGLSDYGVANLLDSSGNSTGISLAADDTNRFNAYNSDGSLVASTGFPADVKRESFFGNDVSFNGFIRPTATWVFGGFNPNVDLTFTFFASRMGVSDNREGLYQVVGATTVSTTLNATNNDTNTASVTVKANASGNVVLNMTKGPNNTNPFGFFYLNAMTIKVNSAPVAVDAGFSVAENSAALTVVGTVGAIDPDAGDVLSYAITTGNVGSAFAINPLTGEITVAGALNFETLAEYILTITVTDDAEPALSDTATITITVIPAPVNDYNAWKAEYGITDGPGIDSDGDGISNIIEYTIGGDPAEQMDAALLPKVQLVTADPDGDLTTSEYLLFTHRRTVRAANNPAVGIKVEWSTNLGAWQNAAGTAGVVINDEPLEAGVRLVKVYIPRSITANGRLFARLGALFAPP
jgi:hypothetical protein